MKDKSLGVLILESELLKAHLDSIDKSRVIHIQQEVEDRIKRPMKGQIKEHKIELVQPGKKSTIKWR